MTHMRFCVRHLERNLIKCFEQNEARFYVRCVLTFTAALVIF